MDVATSRAKRPQRVSRRRVMAGTDLTGGTASLTGSSACSAHDAHSPGLSSPGAQAANWETKRSIATSRMIASGTSTAPHKPERILLWSGERDYEAPCIQRLSAPFTFAIGKKTADRDTTRQCTTVGPLGPSGSGLPARKCTENRV